jgi:rsbT co-antagonist protein RsbR
MTVPKSRLAALLREQESRLLADWMNELAKTGRGIQTGQTELQEQARRFVGLLTDALQKGASDDVGDPVWSPIREFLAALSASRVRQGFSSSETAMFIFSFKQPLSARLTAACAGDAEGLMSELWRATVLLDTLGLFTVEAFQKTREEVILRQQAELLELSTPVVSLWDSILAVPVIGTLDSQRTQVVMESLLERIVQTGAAIAIIDITGVPTVDTLVAQHLLKTVNAARLMGAECIISGIRPQIAQTIVHLGVDLGTVVTKATLADAFRVALGRLGGTIVRSSSGG